MFNFIVYSKDRAAQLELLIRSIKMHFSEWAGFEYHILYKYSDERFKEGYDKIRQIHRDANFKFILEEDFKKQTVSFIHERCPYVCFFVDDMYFKTSFSILSSPFYKYKHDNSILCLSLRMSPYITRCYTEGVDSPPPELNENLMWSWRGCKGDWAYPMSCDGHIFRTLEIFPLLKELDYTSPNYLEGQLACRPIDKPYMICCPESVVANNPINKVQTVNGNRCGDVSQEELNEKFLYGKIISMKNLMMRNNDPHQLLPIEYEDL